MHEDCIYLGTNQKLADNLELEILITKICKARVVPGKYGITELFKDTKQAEMRAAEAYHPECFISLFSGDINLVTTLCIPSEEKWKE